MVFLGSHMQQNATCYVPVWLLRSAVRLGSRIVALVIDSVVAAHQIVQPRAKTWLWWQQSLFLASVHAPTPT